MSSMKLVICIIAVCLLSTVVSQGINKPGDCPPAPGINICRLTCYNDSHCEGINKCCPTTCGGSTCIRPVTKRQPSNVSVKNGFCPGKPSGPWICSSTCGYDGDCRGRKKCCKNRCGAMVCTNPEE